MKPLYIFCIIIVLHVNACTEFSDLAFTDVQSNSIEQNSPQDGDENPFISPTVTLVSPTTSVVPQQFTLTIRATNATRVIATYNNTEYECTYDSATNTWQTPITLDITKNPNEHQITYWAENSKGTQSNHENVTYRWAYHWARRIATDGKTYANSHDEGVAVITDSQGNVYWLAYTACDTDNQVNFAESWGGSDIQSIANDSSIHSSITKINADGSYAWTKFIGQPQSGAPNAYVLSVDSQDNIYVVGKFSGTVNFQYAWGGSDNKTSTGQGAFITKINADGTYGWTKIISAASGQQVFILSCAVDAYDNIFCGGNFFGGSINFAADWSGTENKTPVGQTDVFIMKINSDTSYGWTRQIGGSWMDQCDAIAIDAATSSLYIAGTYNYGTSDVNSTINFASDFSGTDSKTGSGTSYPDGFVTKIVISGSTPAYGWTRVFGNGSNSLSADPSDIKLDSAGNIFLLGQFVGNNLNFAQDFGGSDTKTSSGGTVDIFITKINADGSYGLTRRIGAGSSSHEVSASLAVDSADTIYVSGVFYSTINFAEDFSSSDSKTPDGATDIFITKLSNNLAYGYTKIFGTSGNDRFAYTQQGSQNLRAYAGILYLTANFRQDDSGAGVDFNMAKDFSYTDSQSTVRNADAFIVKLEP